MDASEDEGDDPEKEEKSGRGEVQQMEMQTAVCIQGISTLC